jgi:hypothetical protein
LAEAESIISPSKNLILEEAVLEVEDEKDLEKIEIWNYDQETMV